MARRAIGDGATVALPATRGVPRLIRRVTDQLPDADEVISSLRESTFPGPGLGVRILGEVRKDYADTLRLADHIFIDKKIEFGMVSGQLNGARVTNCLRARQYASNARGTRFPK